jgi:hypothetical protein
MAHALTREGRNKMAYMDFAAHGSAALLEPILPRARVIPGQTPQLSVREWSVVRLAREDNMASIRPETGLKRAIRLIFGLERKNPLSDERLEALRRMAVLSWHYGYNIAPSEISEFLAAGYSERQYEMLLDRIVAERVASRGRKMR